MKYLTIIDVDAHKAARLADLLQAEFGVDRVAAATAGDLSRVLAGAEGVVNATPIGMAHHPGSPIPTADLRPDLWVADIVYRPTETELLRSARATGARTLDGTGMRESIAALKEYAEILREHDVRSIACGATGVVRKADNGMVLLDAVAESTGIRGGILSEDAEAFLSAKGMLSVLPERKGLILCFDLGGSSTEFLNVLIVGTPV